MRRLTFVLSMWLLVTGVAAAAPGAVRCGKLLDVRSGRLLSDQVVTFDADGVITSVAPASGTSAAAIDLSQATCLPGLIDVHTHITGDPTHSGYAGLGISVPRSAVTGAKNARLTLRAGFT
ncbi:MAG TPA: amidohydrolase family protein, partial [Candidatus Acidoferrum sp.]|nr:amidohydrolase family protein [Candidatus Acidoferrum sp.]